MTISAARPALGMLSVSIRWMNGLRLPVKFLVLGLLYVIAVIAVGFGLYLHLNRVVQSSEQELAGIEQVTRITQTMQLMQTHRGLSATLFGDDTQHSAFLTNESALQASLANLAQSVTANTTVQAAWQSIQADWGSLHAQRGL
jgi:hypothetical protein